ncbi:MAG: APC family permease [Holophagaceae bacterium]|nr:APC family permease [Holophagaceae bacterium]
MPNFRRLLLGRRLASDESHHTRLNNPVALAVFSSDALSSVAYATQEIMASLSMALHHTAGVAVVAAGVAGHALFGLSIPVALGIVGLLIILASSYRQTIRAYPGGGGAYIVAKDNLGELPALTAGSSLLVDYVLTVAVSVSSGIAAITAAFPVLAGHNVSLTLIAIAFIAIMNLRGVKESGALFAVPTYGFILCMLALLVLGTARSLSGAPVTAQDVQAAAHQGTGVAGLALVWVFMRAFSAGCTALTGVEAISNGVPAFKEPAAENASRTMLWMVGLLLTMFLGITLLANHYGVVYQHNADPSVVQETLLSQLARQILGTGGQVAGLGKVFYYTVQGFTFAILVVAANTAYADFPRLAALMAKDGFLPRQFSSQGDRLVFSNGILILTGMAGLLVWGFHANTDVLLPLYAAGVFIGFTLSQAGMVRHWIRKKGLRWQGKAFVNGLGALATGIVLVDILITKYRGAGIVVLLVAILVTLFYNIHRHYIRVKAKLAASRTEQVYPHKTRVMVLISGIHHGVVHALSFGKSIAAHGDVEAITVDFPDDSGRESAALDKLRSDWPTYCEGVPLRALRSPYRKIVEPILDEVDRIRRNEPEVMQILIVPEFVTSSWWENLLHNQTALRLKASLLVKPKTIVISVPYHLDPAED